MKSLKTILALVCLVMISKIASAQTCNVVISNSTNCQAHGYIEWYDCNNTVCTYLPFTEPAGSSNTAYSCTGCATVCDVKIVVQYLGGSIPPGSWPYVNSSQFSDAGTSPCTPPAFNVNLSFGSVTSCVIN